MTETRYQRFVRTTGYYDAGLMLLFIVPGVVRWTLSLIEYIDSVLHLPGHVGTFSTFALFFVNMMAAITTVWAVARAHDPKPVYGLWDGVTRIVICVLMIVYVAFLNVTMFLLLFATVEAIMGFFQVRGYVKAAGRS